EEKRREEKRREEKRREEKRREEKRREGFLRAGFIFGSLYRFDRLKKRFSLMLKGGLYRVSGGVSTQYGGLTKTGTALPRPGSKGTVP
ncbi:TPA: hypothetical protein ACFBXV_001536, partial [Neisseria gonorrhoeae]